MALEVTLAQLTHLSLTLGSQVILVQESKKISIWLHTALDGIEVSSDERTRTAAACLELCMEHQCAFIILIENQLYGSAFTLARSVFESYIRGTWIKFCASEAQVSDYLKGNFDKRFQELIDDIESRDGYSDRILSQAKNSGWRILNDLTHSGGQHVIRRNTESHLEPNYSNDEIEDLLNFVTSISLLAGFEVLTMSKTEPEIKPEEFLGKIKEYKNGS